jgi:hypothetical protein
MLKCMRRDCDEDADCMVGFELFVDPTEADDCHYPVDKPVARASTGLALCMKHYTVFEHESAAEMLAGKGVQAAMDICEHSSGFTLDRPRTRIVKLGLTDPEVEMRDHAMGGFINRPFKATVPTGVGLN